MLLSFLAKWLSGCLQSVKLLEHTAFIHQNYGDLLLFKMLMCKVYLPPSYLIGNGPVGNKDPLKNSFNYSNPVGGTIEKLLLSYFLGWLILCIEQISFKGAAEMLLHSAVTSDALIHAT